MASKRKSRTVVKEGGGGRGDRGATRYRRYLFPMGNAELNHEINTQEQKEEEEKKRLKRGGGESEGDNHSSDGNKGDKPDELSNDVKQQVQENTKVTQQNSVRIARIDERTAFLTRVILGVLTALVMAVGAGLVLQYSPA